MLLIVQPSNSHSLKTPPIRKVIVKPQKVFADIIARLKSLAKSLKRELSEGYLLMYVNYD